MTSSTDAIETEVKFYLPDAAATQQRLRSLGAIAGAEHFETNIRYENPEKTLKSADRLLRLRMDDTCRLTFKKRPVNHASECKAYYELEVEVSSFDTMAAILDNLGFTAVQRYDKHRRTFTWRNVEICIDRMPFGTFMEIEGPEEQIKTAAADLSLPWERRILSNYLAIFEMLRHGENLPFDDVTFENFQSYPIDLTPYLPMLWADSGAAE